MSAITSPCQARLIRILVVFGHGWGAAGLSAAVHFVSPGGDDRNPGTEDRPFREIRRGVEVAQPGDEVRVADGSYLGFNVFEKGDRQAGPILIRATGTEAEVVPTTDRASYNNKYNIEFWRSQNVVIEGLKSFNAPTAGCRVVESDWITVRGCTFGNPGYWGIVTSFSNHVTLEDNTCSGSQKEHGIYVANSGDHPIVRGNRLYDNIASGLRMNGDHTMGGDGLITGGLVEGNTIHGNGEIGGAAINANGVQDLVIRNNLIYNNLSSGIALFKGGGSAGPANISIHHNTLDMAAAARYALRLTDVEGAIKVGNNILYNRNTRKGPFSWKTSTDSGWTSSDHNIFAGGLVVTNDNETTDWTLANWQATGNDRNSIVIERPEELFVDLAAREYRLARGSAAIDAGAATETTRDFDQATRPSGAAPDIGAFERHTDLGDVSCFEDYASFHYQENLFPGSDADGDRTSLLMEFARGTNPVIADAPEPSEIDETAAGITVTFPLGEGAATDHRLDFHVQSSADLRSWTTLESSITGKPPVLEATTGTVVDPMFFRMRIETGL